MRRRWLLRPRGDDDAPRPAPAAGGHPVGDALVLEVRDGTVIVSVPSRAVTLLPADVSRIRAALGQAQAVALIERGHW